MLAVSYSSHHGPHCASAACGDQQRPVKCCKGVHRDSGAYAVVSSGWIQRCEQAHPVDILATMFHSSRCTSAVPAVPGCYHPLDPVLG
jgi:hypothetical protein